MLEYVKEGKGTEIRQGRDESGWVEADGSKAGMLANLR